MRRNNSTPLYSDISNAFSSIYTPGKDLNQMQMMNNMSHMTPYPYYGGYNIPPVLPQSVPLSANGLPMAANGMTMASLSHLAAMQPNAMQMYAPPGMQIPRPNGSMDLSNQWTQPPQYNQQAFMAPGFPGGAPLLPPQMAMYQENLMSQAHAASSAPSPVPTPSSLQASTPPASPRITRCASTSNSVDLDTKDTIKEEPEVKKEKKKYLKTEKWQKNVNYLSW